MTIPGSANPLLLASVAEEGAYEIERSVRFNSADSAYLSRTPSSAGNRKTWTWAGWVKRSAFGSYQNVFGAEQDTNNRVRVEFSNTDTLIVGAKTGGSNTIIITTSQVFRDPSSWYHIAFSIDTTQATSSDRVKIYVNGLLVTNLSTTTYPNLNYDTFVNATVAHGIGAYGIPSTYFNGYLADIHFIDGQALDPTSFGEFDTNGVWQPIEYTGSYNVGVGAVNGFHLPFSDNSTAAALGTDTSGNGNDWTVNNLSVGFPVTQNYSATTTGTAPTPYSSSYYALAFDGDTSTSFAWTPGTWAMDWTSLPSAVTVASTLRIYCYPRLGTLTVNINGSNVASITGNTVDWRTISFTGTINTISFSGTDTYSSVYAIEVDGAILIDPRANSVNDSLVDSPTNGDQTDTGVGGEVVGNYATWNPLFSSATLTNGNLDAEGPTNAWHIARGTIAFPTSDKWYWEATVTGTAAAAYAISVATAAAANSVADVTTATGLYGIVNNTGTTTTKFINGTASTISTAAAWAQNDILMCAYDGATGKVWFGRNGTWYPPTSGGTAGDPAAGTNETMTASGTVFPAVHSYGTSADMAANFGQRPFAYTAPSGYKALCTTNLSEPTIADGSTAMDVKLYTGNGSTQTISGLNFSPDFVWIKSRSGAYSHLLFDQIRGATEYLRSDNTGGEGTDANSLTVFTSDGFSVGTTNAVNASSSTLVAWTWDAGSSTVSNTDGSITSSVRANPSAGFSVCTFTKAASTNESWGHGLNAAPAMVITKERNATTNWQVWHTGLSGDTYAIILNSTAAEGNHPTLFSSAPSSSVVSMGTGWGGGNHVAYCFAPVDGYSSMGSFSPNGTTDSSFVYLGFRPRFLLFKRTDSTGNWTMWDTSRDTYNVMDSYLFANSSGAEGTDAQFDALSNGFKIRSSGYASGSTFIYYAVAESPFQYARAR